ncbi:butyrophilin subfamily 1 member A1-like [Denticeps clupeoides]|uniref:butyrophilin subfamily 1 member A1-like n=1 Tax=Denticeps clupeoides TaxID=299321 RepID=UPI0010A2BBD3|nr:butyrophilin subfamily 1 member A1-like [Denticeps clupeoides]
MLFGLVALCSAINLAAGKESFSVASENVTVRSGQSVVLPCWLSPAADAQAMEVRWYRPEQYSRPVLLYREQKILTSSQPERFRNRAALGSPGGLKRGNVSLRIDNVTFADAGPYECYVSSELLYSSALVFLNVSVLGSPLVLSVMKVRGDLVKVTCSSSGWYPEPQLLWSSDEKNGVAPEELHSSRGPEGLFSVQSSVLLSPSDGPSVSCSVSLPGSKDGKEASVLLRAEAEAGFEMSEDHSATPWKSAFAVVMLMLVAVVAVFTGIFYFIRNKKRDAETFISSRSLNLEEAKKHRVNIKLNRATAHHHVVVSEDRKYLRDSEKTGDNTEMGRFHHHTCVLGEPGFSSGCKYWEVVLKQENIDVKAAWWVGLASGSADRSTEAPLTPSGGFWYLSSDGSNGYHVNLDPTFPVSLSTRPGTLGVLVEYEKGRLTFYDVGEKKPILTLVTAFTGDVFPLFNPGTGDSGSVHIPDMIPPSVEAEEQPLLNTDTLNTENETEA